MGFLKILSEMILFSVLLAEVVNFPCNQITGSTGLDCDDVGWCTVDQNTGLCVEDPCVKVAIASVGCDSKPNFSCQLDGFISDYDCTTDTYTYNNYYCHDDYNDAISDCFYNGSLKGESCSSSLGCKTITLGGKSACIYDKNFDACNELSQELCSFVARFCFWSGSKCVLDGCRYSEWDGSACTPNSSCVAGEIYSNDYTHPTQYTTDYWCFDPNNTEYDKCSILMQTEPESGVNKCPIYHNEWCTGKEGCKVIEYEGATLCDSMDPPSSGDSMDPPSSGDSLDSPSSGAHVHSILRFLCVVIFVALIAL